MIRPPSIRIKNRARFDILEEVKTLALGMVVLLTPLVVGAAGTWITENKRVFATAAIALFFGCSYVAGHILKKKL